MAENIKNLCAPIPTELHAQLRQRQEESGQTLSQYMTWLITKSLFSVPGYPCHIQQPASSPAPSAIASSLRLA